MSDPKRFDPLSDGMWENSAGDYVLYADYARLKAEVERVEPELEQRCRELNLSLGQQAVQLRQIGDLKAQLEHIDLLKSVVEKFINSADLKNPLDTQSHCAITEKLKQLPDCILDFTEEQVRDNPAWALAVFRHKVKEMQYKRVHDLNAIGGEQEENARLQAENERLIKAGDAMEGSIILLSDLNDKHPAIQAWNAAKEGTTQS